MISIRSLQPRALTLQHSKGHEQLERLPPTHQLNLFAMTLTFLLRLLTIAWSCCTVASSAHASASATSAFEVETLPNVPAAFAFRAPAASDIILAFRIALAQRNISGLEAELYAVSDPASPRYGAHLSKAQVRRLISFHFVLHIRYRS